MSSTADRLVDLAAERLERGQLDGAIASLRQVLSEDPERADAHAMLALALMAQKRVHAARYEADLALGAEPDLPLAHLAVAHVAMAQRRFADADRHFAILVAEQPLRAAWHREHAGLHVVRRRFVEAQAAYERALELDPDDAETLAAFAMFWIGRGQARKAEPLAQAAMQAAPQNASAIVAMGHVLLGSGDVAAAREHAVWALREQPDSYEALALLAAVKTRANPLLGLWWRYSAWMSRLGSGRSIVVLLGAFVVYRVVVIAAAALGQPAIATGVQWAWYALAAYSFVGPMLFMRALKQEVAGVRLGRDF